MRRVTVYVSDEDWDRLEDLRKQNTNISQFFRDAGLAEFRSRQETRKKSDPMIASSIEDIFESRTNLASTDRAPREIRAQLAEERAEFERKVESSRAAVVDFSVENAIGLAGELLYDELVAFQRGGKLHENADVVVDDLLPGMLEIEWIPDSLRQLARQAYAATIDEMVRQVDAEYEQNKAEGGAADGEESAGE